MLWFILRTALTLGLLAVAAAAPHRLRVHPNPALTIFSIAEGPDGFLWLAASDGLYRYDGFHYHKITSYPFPSARFVAFTRDGSLWCGDFEGLTRVLNNRFEVVLKQEVNNMAAFPDQLFIRTNNLTQVGVDGSVRHLNYRTRRDLTIDSSGRLWSVCLDPKRACWIDPGRPEEIHSIGLPPDIEFQEVAPGAKGRIWAADGEQAQLVENGRAVRELRRRKSRQTGRPGPLLPGRNGQLWFLGETVRGLNSTIDFHDRMAHDSFPPISGLEDSQSHLWVSSFGQGLVEWIPEPEWQRWFPEDFANEATVQVVRDRQGALLLSTQKNLYRWNAATEKWSPQTKEENRYDAVLPLEDGGFLASIRNVGIVRLSPEGKIVERMKDLAPAEEYREIARDGKGRFWVGSKRGLLRIEGTAGSYRLREETLPESPPGLKISAVDLEVDTRGHLWVAYEAGIAWLDDQDRWHKLATDKPVTTLRSFALAPDDIWVAYRRSGVFSRLQRKGEQWNVTHFSATGGYGPVDTDFLKRDSRGWIWRGASNGVYVSDGVHVAPNDWIHIDPGNGLALTESNQYGFFEDTDGSVWIAGEEGLSHFRPDASWFDAPRPAAAPQITRLEADGRVFLFPTPMPPALPSATKILRIDVGALQAPPFRDYSLRYRLLPQQKEWLLSADGSLEFANLPENAYTLELGFAGNGPSAIGAYPFRVGAGGPGLSWLWRIGLLIASGAFVSIVRYAPWLDRTRFRVEKAVFLLRRRYGRRKLSSPSDLIPAVNDYCGTTLSGRYQLNRIISRGGFSVVYEARDLRDGNARLAVKVLNRSAGQESWVRGRFAHEVAALRSVQHPGVVRILDSWISAAGEPCLAMPFLDGQTLRAALDQSEFSLARVARIVQQLGAALAEVHGHGIIHRDLKPENLILLAPGADDEQTVIVDFGTAGLRSAENELAATTLMAGSFHYMAPERLTGRYSAASDVFSLGIIILEMLTGKRLADLNAVFSDPSFESELESALESNLSKDAARNLAVCLSPAYNPEPRRRPTDLKTWADEVAAAMLQT